MPEGGRSAIPGTTDFFSKKKFKFMTPLPI